MLLLWRDPRANRVRAQKRVREMADDDRSYPGMCAALASSGIPPEDQPRWEVSRVLDGSHMVGCAQVTPFDKSGAGEERETEMKAGDTLESWLKLCGGGPRARWRGN